MTNKKISLSSLLTIVSIGCTLMAGAFSLGYHFGVSKFDEPKIKCFQDRESLTRALSASKDSVAALKDTISRMCPCSNMADVYDIFDGHLHSKLDMGLSTSGGKTGWLQVINGEIRMDYPAGQNWGAMSITVGKSVPLSQRKGTDFSKYKSLVLELKGNEGFVVEIGLKDKDDDDRGLETKIPLTLKKDWTVYKIPLNKFQTADLTKLYAVTEFVFTEKAQTVYARKIQFTE